MFQLTIFAALVLAASSVSALLVPRSTPPAGWFTDLLEPYDTYHFRYLALACNSKHNTVFFDQCCHPLLASENLSIRPAQCIPASSFPTLSSSQPTPTASAYVDGDDQDCEDGDDDDNQVPAATPTSIHAISSPVTKAVSSSGSSSATPIPKPTATSISPKNAAALPTSAASETAATQSTSSDVNTGGFATFFYQNGVAGACGHVNDDNALIAAIDGDRYGDLGKTSPLCGKQVHITNNNNGKTVTVTIADACPTCKNKNSIDLSEGAFKKIATLDEGIVPISWYFT